MIFNKNKSSGLPLLTQQAVNSFKSGDLENAYSHAVRSLSKNKNDGKAALVAGCVLGEWQRFDEAGEILLKAHEMHPKDNEILFNLAQLMARAGRQEEAAHWFSRLTERDPDNGDAWNELGCALQELDRFNDAEAALLCAVNAKRNSTRALNNLIYCQIQRGEIGTAVDVLRGLKRNRPDVALLDFNLGFALIHAGLFSEALALLCNLERQVELGALELDDDLFDITLSRIGVCLMEFGWADEASCYFERVISRDGVGVELIVNYAMYQRLLGKQANAWKYAEKALLEAPDDPSVLNLCATLARDSCQLELALDFFERAIKASPGNESYRFFASLTLLGLGRLSEAWEFYDSRWHGREGGVKSTLPWPEWRGESGGSLLIYNEQGLGDEILFSSMFNDLKDRFDYIVCVCNKKLLTLFSRSFPHIVFVPYSSPVNPVALDYFDYQIPMGSLAKILRQRLDCFPVSQTDYILPDMARTMHWKKRFSTLPGKIKVGLAWRSGLSSIDRNMYYPPLAAMGALASVPGVEFINVQYGATEEELKHFESLHGIPLHHAREVDHFDDLDASLALISACDVVVAPCIATGLLSASAGVPTLQLLPGMFDSWMLGQDMHPWVPRLTSIGKKMDEPWAFVFEKLALIIAGLVLEKSQAQVSSENFDATC